LRRNSPRERSLISNDRFPPESAVSLRSGRICHQIRQYKQYASCLFCVQILACVGWSTELDRCSLPQFAPFVLPQHHYPSGA
jgi:hypothetical protein